MLTVLLVSTTEFQSLLKGLEKLKAPRLIITLFSFIYRYLFVIFDEFLRAVRAARCRTTNKSGFIRFFGNAIGVLFVRTYERADRIYQAMLSRGFTGEIRIYNKLSFSKRDKGFLFLSAGVVIIMLLLQVG